MEFEELLICPICKSQFQKVNNTLKCASNHSFDISASGYINLLKPGKMNNAKAGDSKEMIRARSSFFQCGAYQPIKDMICKLSAVLCPSVIVDAGCGEGYYTEGLASTNINSHVIGFDMSKYGCEHGSKIAKRSRIDNVFYSVSSIFEMPLSNSSVDLIVNMFAPVANEEFYRVLRNNGHMIIVSAGVNHLDGLKSELYDKTYKNDLKILDYDGFELVERKNLSYSSLIEGNDNILNLFSMTPYFHRTSQHDKEKLTCLDKLTTTVDVNFSIYKKI